MIVPVALGPQAYSIVVEAGALGHVGEHLRGSLRSAAAEGDEERLERLAAGTDALHEAERQLASNVQVSLVMDNLAVQLAARAAYA